MFYDISESCKRLIIILAPLSPLLTLVAVMLQTHILFIIKTAWSPIILVSTQKLYIPYHQIMNPEML